LTQFAFETGDVTLIDRALDDIRLAKLRLSDSTFVRARSLAVQIRAADLYGKTGQTEKRKAAVDEAERDARALEHAPGFGYVLWRVMYFEFIDDDEAAFAELERASQRPETAGVTAHYALRLYEKGRDAEALSLLDKRLPPGNGAGEMLRVILWADEIGPDKALERCREQVAARKSVADATDVRLFEAPTLVLLGMRKEAADLFRSKLARYPTIVSIQPVNRFLAGDQSEAECLAQAGKNQKLLCAAHFIIGLVRLSEGDRDAAREHFQKTLDTNFWTSPSYTQARAYLARLKRAPEWPKWIPVKK
jgi:tetratricopeptide (TPR) repeat protein